MLAKRCPNSAKRVSKKRDGGCHVSLKRVTPFFPSTPGLMMRGRCRKTLVTIRCSVSQEARRKNRAQGSGIWQRRGVGQTAGVHSSSIRSVSQSFNEAREREGMKRDSTNGDLLQRLVKTLRIQGTGEERKPGRKSRESKTAASVCDQVSSRR